MIKSMQRYFASVSPIFLDGCIAVALAACIFLQTAFAQDFTAELVGKRTRAWISLALGTVAVSLHALSKFRDQTFSRYVNRLEVAEDEQKQIDREDRADRRSLSNIDTGP